MDVTLLYFICVIAVGALLVAIAWIHVEDIDLLSVAFTLVSAAAFYKASNLFIDGSVTTSVNQMINGTMSTTTEIVQNGSVSSILQWVGIILFLFCIIQVYTIYKGVGE